MLSFLPFLLFLFFVWGSSAALCALPYKRMADNVLDLKSNGFSIHCMIERCKKDDVKTI